jgi:Domain of unknown function (DUF4132)
MDNNFEPLITNLFKEAAAYSERNELPHPKESWYDTQGRINRLPSILLILQKSEAERIAFFKALAFRPLRPDEYQIDETNVDNYNYVNFTGYNTLLIELSDIIFTSIKDLSEEDMILFATASIKENKKQFQYLTTEQPLEAFKAQTHFFPDNFVNELVKKIMNYSHSRKYSEHFILFLEDIAKGENNYPSIGVGEQVELQYTINQYKFYQLSERDIFGKTVNTAISAISDAPTQTAWKTLINIFSTSTDFTPDIIKQIDTHKKMIGMATYYQFLTQWLATIAQMAAYRDEARGRYMVIFYTETNQRIATALIMSIGKDCPQPLLKVLVEIAQQHATADTLHYNGNFRIELMKKIIQSCNAQKPSAEIIAIIAKIVRNDDYAYYYAHNLYDTERITLQKILNQYNSYQLSEADTFGATVNTDMKAITDTNTKAAWQELINLFAVTVAKPTKEWLKTVARCKTTIGTANFYQNIEKWLAVVAKMKQQQDEVRGYRPIILFADINEGIAKAMIWSIGNDCPKSLAQVLAKVCIKCCEKIPGVGAQALSVGNACIAVLSSTDKLETVGLLSQIRLKVPLTNVQTLVDKNIQGMATRLNIPLDQIQDMAINDFGLNAQNQVEIPIGEAYKAVITAGKNMKVTLDWQNTNGSPLKSEPASLKKQAPDELKSIKETVKEMQASISALRERTDNIFRQEKRMNWTFFEQYFLNHALVSIIARQLIWTIDCQGNTYHVIYENGSWMDVQQQKITFTPDEKTVVTLWHPVGKSVANIVAWRDFLTEKQIQQPIKQAYREVYLLTEAEIRTDTYSNRMAAHIIKQHQFTVLAKLRGWRYALLGNYDHGRQHTNADVELPAFGLRAEFWINELYSEDAGSTTDAGIWNYIGTDQVRFYDKNSSEPMHLRDVNPLALSEILRDVDMFVGVCSIGNDPQWQNNNQNRHLDYWQSYSFGDLNEVAKTRLQVLTKLLPKLKIAKIAEIRDKFLVVKGKLRTYKIHIGSTNILMEPNDQYLCIVPSRKTDAPTTNVFLPFEGDTGLSVIISKAFLLAEDDKITDETITRQLEMR